MVLPFWVRAVRAADRYAWYAYHAHEIVRDEVLFAFLDRSRWAELTASAYSDLSTYLPGGTTFEAGLFAWERVMLANPQIPRHGRVLLGAAGGGRELKALAEAKYEVIAFEPNARLLEGARGVASAFERVSVNQAKYQDLIHAVEHDGPLARLAELEFDWVLFGWGSFTHVTDPLEQRAVLRAVRRLAPRAPVALSFFLSAGRAERAESRSARARSAIRRVLHTLGAPGRPQPSVGYEYGGGFVYRFSKQEFERLAAEAGYAIEVWDETAFPYAILAPVT